ncbi:hypothetical protein [Deinococcus misasensis]|uniref:hypothetical protein n=1 Tax=Deinococcus misasensis TaxID=392413 RepID=UPI000550E65D|nr:hypothetical protein [Deinococcus misasensis]
MKWIEWLLKLYPVAFREQYARDILLNIRDMHQDVQASEGRVAAQVFLLRSGMDVIQVAVKEQTKANFRMTRQTLMLSAGLVFTMMGTVSYGIYNYQRQQPNPAILSWMDPRVHVEEVTSDPVYQPLIHTIRNTYSTSKIKIWLAKHDYGFMRGTESRLMVSVLTRDLDQPLNKRPRYPSNDALTALYEQANQSNPEKAAAFRKKTLGIAEMLKSLPFDEKSICLTSPSRVLPIQFEQQPGKVFEFWTFTAAQLVSFPAHVQKQMADHPRKKPVAPEILHTFFGQPRVYFQRVEDEALQERVQQLDSIKSQWVSIGFEKMAGCNQMVGRWPTGGWTSEP